MPSAAFRSRRRMKSTFAGRRALARSARCILISAGSPLESTASLPQAPWCSTRIHRSTRLAVAANGSPCSLETSEQKRLGGAMLATFDDADELAERHGLSSRHRKRRDGPGPMGGNLVLHLHRLDDA